MSVIALKPCPFCGGEAKLYGNTKLIGTKLKHYQVTVCTNDDCGCRTGLCETVENAIEAWNTRKPLDDIIRELEEEESTAQMYTGEYEDYDEYHHGQAVAFRVALEKLKAKETPTT